MTHGDFATQPTASNAGEHELADEIVKLTEAAHGIRAGEGCQEHADLMKFYGATDLSALVEAQHQHIEKLQAKLPRNDQPAFTRVREG